MKRFGYAVWGAAGAYIILSCVWAEFQDCMGYWLPAIGFEGDNGLWWVQFPVLAFLVGIICFGVVMTGYNVLSRILD